MKGSLHILTPHSSPVTMRSSFLWAVVALMVAGSYIGKVTSQGRRPYYESFKNRNFRDVPILAYNNHITPEGSYRWNYETGHGIVAQEQGSVKNRGIPNVEAMNVEGSYSYQDDNGVVLSVTYTADENGFHPQGAHLPTPPPTPDYILRALAYIGSLPPTPEETPSYQSRAISQEEPQQLVIQTTPASGITENTSTPTAAKIEVEPKCLLEDVQYKIGEPVAANIPFCASASCKLVDGEPAITCDKLEEPVSTTSMPPETSSQEAPSST